MQFSDPEDFIARWLDGLLKAARADFLRYGSGADSGTAAQRLVRMLKTPTVRKYTFTFLRRNFYRQLNARTRAKPPEDLWGIWFGGKSSTYGILIAPKFRNGEWTNDRSEMRHAPYIYWTIGHVLETGLVSPDESEPLKFSDLRDILRFYRFVLKNISNSKYEKAIAVRYIEYLQQSADALSEPFLIPEFRYGGLDAQHKHRLDYTVFNGHTMRKTGFELSPYSTHGAVRKLKNKTQVAVNREGAATWEKEMQKRNDYFAKYDVPIVTFTDSMLRDIDNCFQVIGSYLTKRPKGRLSLDGVVRRLAAAEV